MGKEFNNENQKNFEFQDDEIKTKQGKEGEQGQEGEEGKEEKNIKSKKNITNPDDKKSTPHKIRLEYISLLEEEEIDISDLPKEIKNHIQTHKALISRYNTTPTGNIYKTIIKKDLEICDMIQNWLEEDLPEEELEHEQQENEKEEEKKESPENQQQKEKPEQKENQKIEKLKQAILSKVKDNKITVKDLTDILGRHPKYPEEIIGDIRLRKNFLRSDYSLLK